MWATGQRSEKVMRHGPGQTQVERGEGGMEEFFRWSANVCDPNTRTDLVSTENRASFQSCMFGFPILGPYG